MNFTISDLPRFKVVLKLRRWSPKFQLWQRRLTLTNLVQIWRFGLQRGLT